MTFKEWLNIFIDENELDRKHVFEIKHKDTLHFMDFENLVDSILSLPEEHRKKIKDKLVCIDSENVDLMHYLKYVTQGFIKYKT